MQKHLLSIIKVVVVTSIFFLIMCLIYALIVQKNNNTNYKVASIVIGFITFFIYGFLVGNHFQKKGLLVSFLFSFCLLGIIVACLLLTNNKLSLSILLKYLSFIASAILGGILGVNIKKFI